jgi:hypothetical protein
MNQEALEELWTDNDRAWGWKCIYCDKITIGVGSSSSRRSHHKTYKCAAAAWERNERGHLKKCATCERIQHIDTLHKCLGPKKTVTAAVSLTAPQLSPSTNVTEVLPVPPIASAPPSQSSAMVGILENTGVDSDSENSRPKSLVRPRSPGAQPDGKRKARRKECQPDQTVLPEFKLGDTFSLMYSDQLWYTASVVKVTRRSIHVTFPPDKATSTLTFSSLREDMVEGSLRFDGSLKSQT